MTNPENNKWLEQIDPYLKGELNNTEHKAFEDQLTLDNSLQEEVIFRKEVRKTLQEESELSGFRDLQKTIEEELKTPPPSGFPKWTYLVFPILLVISSVYLYYSYQNQARDNNQPKQETNTENTLKESTAPATNIQEEEPTLKPQKRDSETTPAKTAKPSKTKEPIASSSKNTNRKALLAVADQYHQSQLIGQLDFNIERGTMQEDSLLTLAAQTFNQQNYKTAFPLLQTLYKKHPQQKELLYPLGVCYLSTEPKKSLALLKEAFNYNAINREQWHLALAYLKTGATEEARKNLQEIIAESMNQNDLYRINAIQLLQKIDVITD